MAETLRGIAMTDKTYINAVKEHVLRARAEKRRLGMAERQLLDSPRHSLHFLRMVGQSNQYLVQQLKDEFAYDAENSVFIRPSTPEMEGRAEEFVRTLSDYIRINNELRVGALAYGSAADKGADQATATEAFVKAVLEFQADVPQAMWKLIEDEAMERLPEADTYAAMAGWVSTKTKLIGPNPRLATALKDEAQQVGGNIDEAFLEGLPGAVVVAWSQRKEGNPPQQQMRSLRNLVSEYLASQLPKEWGKGVVFSSEVDVSELQSDGDPVPHMINSMFMTQELAREDLRRIAAKAGLSRQEHDYFELWLYEPEAPAADFATALNITEGTVGSIKFRVFRKFGAVIKGERDLGPGPPS
jgi:hypothetical protein